MAISIDSSPKAVDFSRNAFGFALHSSILRHERAMLYVLAPAIGDTVTLRWKDEEHVFTFVAASDESGTQLTVSTDPTVIALDFLKNSAVAETYSVVGLLGSAYFYELTPDEYIPLFVEQTNTPFSITEYNSLAYGFYAKLCTELKIRESGDMVSKGKSFQSFINSHATIELGSKLLPFFTENSIPPNHTTVQNCLSVLEYMLTLSEFNPVNTPAYQNAIDTDSFFALDGKIPYAAYPAFSLADAVSSLSTLLPNTRTWRDAHQEVTLLAVGAESTVTFQAKIYFVDGTDQTVDVLAAATLAANTAYSVPAGFNDLGLDRYETGGKEAYRYELHVSTGLSFSFVIIDKPYLAKVLRYKNYLGGYQSFLTEGVEVRKVKTTVILGQTNPVVGHAANTPTVFKETATINDTYSLNIGMLYAEEMDLYRDLLSSRMVYKQVGAEWKRIHITTDSTTITDENEDMNEATIDYQFATPC